jgi:hypothetical protein
MRYIPAPIVMTARPAKFGNPFCYSDDVSGPQLRMILVKSDPNPILLLEGTGFPVQFSPIPTQLYAKTIARDPRTRGRSAIGTFRLCSSQLLNPKTAYSVGICHFGLPHMGCNRIEGLLRRTCSSRFPHPGPQLSYSKVGGLPKSNSPRVQPLHSYETLWSQRASSSHQPLVAG